MYEVLFAVVSFKRSSSFSGGETNLNINPNNLFAVKVKANWKTAYNVTYNLSGGSISGAPTFCAEGDVFDVPKPTKSGYVFTGWTYGDSKDQFEMRITCTSNITLTASWGQSVWDKQYAPYNSTISSYRDGVWTITNNNTQQMNCNGIEFYSSNFQEDGRYYVHFKMQKISGELKHIRGHAYAQNKFQRFYINDVLQDAYFYTWEPNNGDVVHDDTKIYDVKLYFDYSSSSSANGDLNFYIEPNRKSNTPLTWKLWDFDILRISS